MKSNLLKSAIQSYWNSFYSSGALLALPSQFAVFVACETSPKAVVDLGCGNGRDSLFFAQRHIPVVGVDASDIAIAHCSNLAMGARVEHASFICSDITAPDLGSKLHKSLGSTNQGVLLYSRFFLHAIDKEAQLALFDLAGDLMMNRSGWLALEFRTPEDQDRTKVTPKHYRRYVPLSQAIEVGRKHGFEVSYSVQGLGMAKYKSDDAYVGRIIFRRA